MISTELEPLFQKTLFLLTGQEWKNMRGTLSPSFTGKKIRIMFTLMKDCAKQFNEFFLRQNEDIVELEIKDVMTRYTNDVIVSCVLGMKCNSINDKENDFYKMAKSVLSNSLTVWVKSMMQVTIPWLAKVNEISFSNCII